MKKKSFKLWPSSSVLIATTVVILATTIIYCYLAVRRESFGGGRCS